MGKCEFEKDSFISIEKIKGKIVLDEEIENKQINVSLRCARVFDWYDEVLNIEGKGIIDKNILSFECENGLEEGVYILLQIKDEDNSFAGDEAATRNPLGAFIVGTDSRMKPLDIYTNIGNIRERAYGKPKGRFSEDKTIPFHVFVFCKNIKVSTLAQYGDVQIFPYEYLKLTSEVNYINSFFNDNFDLGLTVYEEEFNSSIPSAVYMVTNIWAYDYQEAEKYALEKIDILNGIFTALLRSHGTYFATVTLNTKEKMSRINMLDTRYKGNLLLFAEQGFNIRHYYSFLSSKDSYIKFYLKLLNEAMKEDNRMFKYYRYWNILEGIALRKNYEHKEMKKWDGTSVICKGKIVSIGNKALDNVFELIREFFGNELEKDFIADLDGITMAKEFVSICYQRRNCCAHQGGCYENDDVICLKNKKDMERCKKNNTYDEKEPIPFRDKILVKLENITFRIVLIELGNQAGKVIKEDNIIENMLKV